MHELKFKPQPTNQPKNDGRNDDQRLMDDL